MLRAALAASPPDVANRWVWPARWRQFARGPAVALQVEWQSLAVRRRGKRRCCGTRSAITWPAWSSARSPNPRRCWPSAEFLGCCLVVGARRLKPRGNTWKAPLGAPATAIRDAVAARRAL
jgi:hypothetical protein